MSKIITVKIIPNAQKTELREILPDGIQKIAVSALPEKGKANKELIKFFKKTLNKNIKILKGTTHQYKIIEIL